MTPLSVEPCTLALFGALGDLALRKLFPALYQLDRAGLLPTETRLLALARESGEAASHLAMIEEHLRRHVGERDLDEAVLQRFMARLDYLSMDFRRAEDFAALADKAGNAESIVAFFATPASVYGAICAGLAEAGLAERTDIRLQDYRDVTGQFDRIVSVEMIEAVGERWWPTYFATIRDRLVPGGKAGLQAITIADERFDTYRRGCDFIQRHVFPGGMLPSPGALQAQADAAGLSLSTPRCFGMDYERTLGLWEHDFQQAWSRIAPLGFDTRFKRLWEFYIAYCRAGFRTKAIDVCHLLLTRD